MHPDAALSHGGAGDLTPLLLREWIRRDFDEVLEWFSRAPSASRFRIARSLASEWPVERAREGLDFVRKDRDEFTSVPLKLVVKSIEQEATNGAAAVAQLLQLFHQEKIQEGTPIRIDFPPGFDFATLAGSEGFAAIRDTGVGGAMLREWFAQDRQQAFDGILEKLGPRGLPPLLNDPYTGGAAKDTGWIAKKLERLAPGTRTEFINSMMPDWVSRPALFVRFAESVTDPTFLREVSGAAPQLVFGGRTHQAMPLLEAVPDPAERIRMLEIARPAGFYERSRHARHVRHFPETDEALLRKKLAEWGAAEPQIESVISRFKP